MKPATEYNYIYYGVSKDWFANMLGDVAGLDNVAIHADPFESKSKLLNSLYKFHTYPQTDYFFEKPFKGLWNKHTFDDAFPTDKPRCFIFTGKYCTHYSLLRYLKKRYPGSKTVMLIRDVCERYEKWYHGFDPARMLEEFDLVMSINRPDCQKYGFKEFIDEAPQKLDISPSSDVPIYDLFCVIADKGRVDLAVKIHKLMAEHGVRAFTYVYEDAGHHTEVPGVIFSDKMMPYNEYVQHMVDSNCVLELVQDDMSCFTNRAKEAFIYNKKLITNSSFIKEQRFYPSDNILYFENPEDIDPDFVKKVSFADYGYDDDYSAMVILHTIEKELKELG